MSLGLVALVGAPSSGKSTIFNRIVGERRSIVEETRGVTRDRLYAKATWLTKEFTVIDTGGIQVENAPFQEEVRSQVELALDEADLIVFVLDSKLGVTADDRLIARLLRGSRKPVLLAVNKVDSIDEIANASEFYKLGFGDFVSVSGAHGIGIGDLLDEIIRRLPERTDNVYENAITFALIGRPNVGKSSLTNRILKKDRAIVSSISGTTRDALDTPFSDGDDNYVAIDTAGLLRRGKIYESIDKYAAIRAMAAIERAEVVLLLVNADEGIREQDKHVAGYAFEAQKAIIIVISKWDLAKAKGLTKESFTEQVRKEFKFLDYAPIVFTSAENGEGVAKILPLIKESHLAFNRRIPTPILNEIIRDAQDMNPTPNFNHGRLKISYANQAKSAPPTFVMFCNNPKFAHFSYTRYLENRIRESFDFAGTPVSIVYRIKK